VGSRRTRAGRAGPARAKLRPHTVSPRLAVPEHIMRPPYVDTGENPFYDEVQVHDAQVRSHLPPQLGWFSTTAASLQGLLGSCI